MKIGLVLERFDPARGGLEHWSWQFARCLLARGHEVHVVAFDFAPETSADLRQDALGEMPRSRIARGELIAQRLPALGLDLVHDMGIGWRADLIHPHGGSTIALWEHNLLRIPKWRQIRFWREKRYRELAEVERRQLAQSDARIVAVSRMVQGHFEQYHGLAPERIRVIHNGVDTDRFTPDSRATLREPTRRQLGLGEETMFLMLAHNLLLKNADATLRALALVLRRGAPVRLVIAGGKRPEPFVKLAQHLAITPHVTFMGSVDAAHYYAAADVFVHPTWYDPCSLVTLEAAAAGLPVVTTRFNGASEMMRDGVDGFVLENPADVATLADRMQSLADKPTREAMGGTGRETALRHTFEHQTSQFLALYDEIIAARR